MFSCYFSQHRWKQNPKLSLNLNISLPFPLINLMLWSKSQRAHRSEAKRPRFSLWVPSSCLLTLKTEVPADRQEKQIGLAVNLNTVKNYLPENISSTTWRPYNLKSGMHSITNALKAGPCRTNLEWWDLSFCPITHQRCILELSLQLTVCLPHMIL